jgi:hypothetical protein
LQPWSLLRKALIRAAKTSPTAGTLYDIFATGNKEKYCILKEEEKINDDKNILWYY